MKRSLVAQTRHPVSGTVRFMQKAEDNSNT